MPNIALIEGNKLSDSGSDLTAISGQTYARLHSGRDFPNGTLIETTIDYSVTNGDPWVLEITGNSYFSLIPFDLTYQGYIYNNTMIAMGGMSTGTTITGMSLFNYNGKLCFWFPYQAYWQGFNVYAYTAYSGRKENRVTAITNVAKPAGVTKEISMTFQQVVRTSSSTVGTANYVSKFTGNGILADSQIFDNGTNVGISTASPFSKFTVSGTASTSQISIVNTEGGHFILRSGIPGVSNNGASFVIANVDGTNQNTRMVISSAGDIGINTTSPAGKLDVIGASTYLGIGSSSDTFLFLRGYNGGLIRFQSNTGFSGTYNGLGITTNSNGVNSLPSWNFDFGGQDGVNFVPDAFSISRKPNGGSYTTFLTVRNTGNIGIGTTSPQAPLHIDRTVTGSTTADRTTPVDVLVLESENINDTEYTGFGQSIVFRGVTYGNGTLRSLGKIIHQINDNSIATTIGTSLDIQLTSNPTSSTLVSRFKIEGTGVITIPNLAGTGSRIVVADANGSLSATTLSTSVVGGSGTVNRVAKFTATGTVGDSQIFDNGTNVGIGTVSPGGSFHMANVSGAIFGSAAGSIGTLQLTSSSPVSPISGRILFGTDGTGWQLRVAKNTAGSIVDLLFLQDNGNLGVGANNPGAPIHIVRSGGSVNSINVGLIVDFEATAAEQTGAGTAIQFRGKSGGGDIANYNQAQIATNNVGSNNSHGLSFFYKPDAAGALTEGFRLHSNGFVGIGTTTPDSNLQVGSSGTSGSRTIKITDANYGLLLSGGNGPTNNYIQSLGTTIPLYFLSGNANNGNYVFSSTGNLGIGTTSPQRKLHIATANGTASQIQIGQTSQRDYYIGIPASQTYLDFYDASAGASRMAVFSDGNVAINTLTNAGYKFDVNGTTRFGGTTTFNSTIVQKNFSSIIISNLSASATQARQFEILRGFYDYNDWSSSIGVVEIEVHESYYSRGLKKVYTFTYGYYDSSSLFLTEMTGTGDNTFRVTMGAKVLISGDMYYVPIYVEVRNYVGVDVIIRTRRAITTNNLSTTPGALYVNESPTAVNISDFTSDTIVYPNNAAVNQVVLGNLGVGSNPSYKLDVDGITRFRNIVRFKTNSWNLSDDGQNRFYYENAGSSFYGTGSSHIWRNSSDTTLMTLLSSGNLGINTTTPAGLLDISGGSYNTGLIVRSSSANGSGVAILNSSAGGKHWYIISTGGNNGGGAGNLGFYNDSDGDYRVYFSAAGNVGISTTSPGYKLEVVGQGGSVGTTIMARATTDDPGITAYSTSQTGKPHIKLLNGLYSHKIWLAGDGTGDLYFSVDYASTTPKVVFKGNGNVGIGTISPTFVAGGGLHVKMAGDANIRITGGSNTGFDLTQASDGNNYIYNRDNSAFIFGTNNTERVRIAADGKLIVNSASSFGAYQFQVNGASYISGQTTLANLAGTGTRMVVADANGLLSTQAIPSGGGGSGTVTSVGLTIGSSGTDVNVSNSPITTSGNITLNIPDASATARGLVNTTAQTFAGDKTFTGQTTVNSVRTDITNGAYGMYMFTRYNVTTATTNANVYATVDYLMLNLANGAITGGETFNVTANLNQVAVGGNTGTVSTQPIRGIISGLLGIPTGSGGGVVMNIADFRYFEAKTPDRASLTGHVVQNIYGLKIGQLRGATGYTITNGWGIYQEGSQDNNYFNGSVVIGSATVGNYKLDVTSTFRVNTGTVPVAIESFANPGIGTVASVYSTGTNSTIAFGSQANDTYLVGGFVFIGNQSAKFMISADTLTGAYDGWGSIGSSAKYMKEVYTNYLVSKQVFSRQTASYTLVSGDRSKVIEMNVGSANTLTVPTNASVAFPIGTQITIIQYGAGQTTIAGAGVTFRSTNNWLKINAQYGSATIIKVGTDEWYVVGNLSA